MRGGAVRHALLVTTVAFTVWAGRAGAYPTYSQNRDATYCRQCHGNFLSESYVSLHDGAAWKTNLMSGHNAMIAFACAACHQSADNTYPVMIGQSGGDGGLVPMGCVGCHGRDADAGHDDISPGRGAGLRQHHFRAGIDVCATCHTDADPAKYTPVGENVPPADYFVPDAAHPSKPTDPCNANGSESKYGTTGLDNDGNGLYDLKDPACAPPPATSTPTAAPTPTATPKPCAGDCNDDRTVTIDEILTMVRIALGNVDVSCGAGDPNHDGRVTVDDIVAAVNAALTGCAG